MPPPCWNGVSFPSPRVVVGADGFVVVAFLFTSYVLSFFFDLRPSVRTKELIRQEMREVRDAAAEVRDAAARVVSGGPGEDSEQGLAHQGQQMEERRS
jgi:hypothetical protein